MNVTSKARETHDNYLKKMDHFNRPPVTCLSYPELKQQSAHGHLEKAK